MKNNERIIQFFDIDVYGKSRSRDIKHKLSSHSDMAAVMQEVYAIREKSLARMKLGSKKDREMRLEDFEERDDCWVLLFNIVDTRAAHPVVQRMGGEDKDRRTVELDNENGLESSSHVILYKRKNSAGKYLALYERNPSIPFHSIVVFIRSLFRLCAKNFPDRYKLPHPSGEKGKFIKVYCSCEYYGHPSDEFKDELATGTLSEIKLTSDVVKQRGYDSNKHKELVASEIKMTVKRAFINLNGGNWGHIEKAISYADTLDMPFVRVSFQDKTGASHSAKMSTDTSQLVNADKYVRKHKIHGFGNTLKTAFPVIHTGIINKMLELVR